ncbi:MAG TPA: SCO family protein [Pyrinomonadaceae bacterium]|nr:SCO family protein [Pyrinomonadaceae bacterium]
MLRAILFVLLVIVTFSACQKPAPPQNTSAEAKRYTLKGKVISVDKAKKTATIEHGEIKGYMPAMTMEFPVHADWIWEDLKPGAEISSAELVVDETAKEPFWLENLALVLAPNPNQAAPPVDERFAQIGKEIPEFTLTNQDGKRISTKDFKGKTWAITFIYARCPLPDYCIKMSTNFSDAALQIMGSDFKDKMRLLSVSFDPENDTPAKLRAYGQGYLGKDAKPDFSVWQLAVGDDEEVRAIADFFGLRYETDQNDKTQINHSLRTAVISPEGKVTKVFAGNEWTANDLLREMKSAGEAK